jgi:Ca2+-transporting ATPase
MRMRNRIPRSEATNGRSARATAHAEGSEPGPRRAKAGAGVVRVHVLPGRERLKVAGLQRNPSLKRALEARLAVRQGVISVRANISTGSVVLEFDERRYRHGVLGLARRVVARLDTAEEVHARSWHSIDAGAALQHLRVVRESGLSPAEAGERCRHHGANLLPQPPSRSGASMFADQFRSLPVALLGGSAALALATGGLADALVIGAVVLINAAIGFFTERSAERVIHGLGRLAREHAQVLRGGLPMRIDPAEVAPGDLLFLAPGTVVTADARLLDCYELTVDESALTGESMPVAKRAEPVAPGVPLAERSSMVYRATTVTGGNGLAVAVATGRGTEVGRIHALVGETAPPETPLQKQLALLGRRLVVLSAPLCGAMFLLGVLRGQGVVPMLKTSTALFVAAIPEGLAAVATTILALGVRDLRRDGVLVRRLHAVEALGAVQTLCMDKTGTLTRNRMRAVELATAAGRLSVGAKLAATREEVRRLIALGVLCSDATRDAQGISGSATEGALLGLAGAAGLDFEALRRGRPKLETVHRTEARPWMVTVHDAGEASLVAVKGSPVEVLALCTRRFAGGVERELKRRERWALARENAAMARRGLRVLGFAYRLLGPAESFEAARPDKLVWCGFVGIADPLRADAAEAVAAMKRAGVTAAMITGDQRHTALAIGRELGFAAADVYARVSPAQKLQVVQALQRAGRVVAMTGDGINDGPALRCADVGIALGRSGAEIARSVADIVLEDDALSALLVALRQGRATYDNLRKSIHFLLATNLSEMELMLCCAALGVPAPLTPVQLLWLNLASDVFPALGLALEPPEPDVLARPPRDPSRPIAGRADAGRLALRGSLMAAGALAAHGAASLRSGAQSAGSTAFMSLTAAQLLHAFSARSEHHGIFNPGGLCRNPRLAQATGVSAALQAAAVLVPGLRSLLGVARLSAFDFAVAAAGAVAPFLANEALKVRSARR